MSIHAQLAAEYDRLAMHYATLALPVCVWSNDHAAALAWAKKLSAHRVLTDIEALDNAAQQKLAEQIERSSSGPVVAVLSNDPYILVQKGKLTHSLATQLLTLPLQIV